VPNGGWKKVRIQHTYMQEKILATKR